MKSVMGSETILFIGAHFEIKNPGSGQEVTKYYFAGASRIALRKYAIPQYTNVEYLLGDHLGSTSLTTDANGTKVSEMRYKPWGEVRYSWTDSNLNTTPSCTLTKYTFTGQYSNMSDFGLMFYNARMYDPLLGRFTSVDIIIPSGQQGLDRYAYTLNNPLRYTDPSGHNADGGISDPNCIGKKPMADDVEFSKLSDYIYKGTGVSGKMMYEFYLRLLRESNGNLSVKGLWKW